MIKLALADDQNLFRKGMSMLLRELHGMEVTLECANGKDLLKAIAVVPVDIVLLDLEMPVMDGVETMKRMRTDHPEVKVLVLSMHSEEKFIVHLMELGANGYLLKTAEAAEVETAIRSVAESGYYFSDMVSQVMLQGLVKKDKVRPYFNVVDPLSERELEVLKLICAEKTTPEIAEQLFLSPRTVEGHRNNILLKTGARNVAGLVVFAMTNGIHTP
ncbi:MAG TPA: response regulator transcription factor [Flavobacteriales bacterium]|nr:response regulator transcription factor [Flavobacteriales bacterium]